MKKAALHSGDILLLQSPNFDEKSCNIHPCEIIFALQLMPKGYARSSHHDQQASSMCVFHPWHPGCELLEVC